MGRYNDIMQNTKKPNTITTIADDFRKLDIVNGEILCVHSSLSSIGYVIGGAEAVIWALLQAVGEDGTVVMPAHSTQNCDPKDRGTPPPIEWHELIRRELPAFNLHITATGGMGIIAETFRTFPNTLRSNHPQMSMCANGKYARKITEEHVLTPQFGMNTPLGKLYNLKAKVLLIGVSYNVCTCLHLSETLSGVIPYEDDPDGAAIINKDGEREWILYTDIDWGTINFGKIGADFEKEHCVKNGNIGTANCKLFELAEIVDFGIEWIKNKKKY